MHKYLLKNMSILVINLSFSCLTYILVIKLCTSVTFFSVHGLPPILLLLLLYIVQACLFLAYMGYHLFCFFLYMYMIVSTLTQNSENPAVSKEKYILKESNLKFLFNSVRLGRASIK